MLSLPGPLMFGQREREGQGLVDIIIIIIIIFFNVIFLIVVKVLVPPGAAFC